MRNLNQWPIILINSSQHQKIIPIHSAVDSGGAGGARAPPKFGGSEKRWSLISAFRSLAITVSKHLWIWKAIYGADNRRPRPQIVHICVGLYVFAKNFLLIWFRKIACRRTENLWKILGTINYCIFIFIKGTWFHDHPIRQCAYQSTVLKALLLCIKSIF